MKKFQKMSPYLKTLLWPVKGIAEWMDGSIARSMGTKHMGERGAVGVLKRYICLLT
jgi:hypothetical protein